MGVFRGIKGQFTPYGVEREALCVSASYRGRERANLMVYSGGYMGGNRSRGKNGLKCRSAVTQVYICSQTPTLK